MRHVKLALFITALATVVHAETFTVDTNHADLGFTARHLMINNVEGHFNSFQGTVDYDMAKKTLISAQGSIDTASIDTNNSKRDTHLKSKDFFDVAKYPKMTFKSTTIKKTGDNTYDVTGKLTVLGVDHDLTIPVTVSGPIDDPWGNKRIGIQGSTKINRRDLGITSFPSSMIGDEVTVTVNAEAAFKPKS